jgi:hypothetical protein
MKNTVILPALVLLIGIATAQQVTTLKPLNINFKNRGYCYAASAHLKSAAGFGGWGGSDNLYQPVSTSNELADNTLKVVLKPEERHAFAAKLAGFALYVINATNDTIFFEAQDSRLNLKLQAQDKKGEWRDIEYLPGSWCGNSYHHVYLPSRYQWMFVVPEYAGTLRTKIRAALGYQTGLRSDEQWLYSNEIEGSVNPDQFDKMPKYKPNGIMDPYNN